MVNAWIRYCAFVDNRPASISLTVFGGMLSDHDSVHAMLALSLVKSTAD